MRTTKRQLKSLSVDGGIIEVRPVNDYVVSRYRQAMREGAVFPPMIIDQGGFIISGNHRFRAMVQEFGEDHTVEVEVRRYLSKAARLEDAVRDNLRHGEPLDGISRRRAVLRLLEFGRTATQIASLMQFNVKRVDEIAGMAVVVVGGDYGPKGKLQPLKHGAEHMVGRKVSAKDYDAHRAKDRAVPAKQQAEQLTRWIKAGWIDREDTDTMDALRELVEVIKKIL